ncbi:phosphogluconate dehydrogenase (NADP(+)-dependent, decarboxylating) [Cryobacterium sp. LW097]|nr:MULTISPECIES: NADP-dependent phosphogluconate dehydrogenase [unclassified Cryobacterium]TFC50968.1 NADP-dependent phosphogluconate dehydrogenase [Cryobacterium sp. TMB3-1-2]TFC74314.1 NADP-dependent phosphogluconate dehydrogenase [Cryobacterium sp. TMB3-15]TFC79827.1 NADP-dependent phosphogluconate dehydrogenase [Cryobacterium sp. TMB3-10]TFD40778.1 NADP-dependent phosphogluconate dehydrogenase [Cryobacterium sp. TMB3-12]ASD22674.1 phosphogluconate dehydrogenase (NADP(+)-dependent, decarbox
MITTHRSKGEHVSETGSANIGVVGLAVMGSNLARNLASREGNTVAVYNRSPERTRLLMDEHPEAGFVASETIEAFVASLKTPRTAIIMVQAGKGTDAVISQLTELFEPGDIIVDGGNALFTDTLRREKAVRETGINFVGAGISGGEEGALKGPSIMPGGSAEAYVTLGPILESIAAVVDGEPCVTHVGTDGAGHFVKMIHNGIEYADMQLIGEAYDLIRRGTGKTPAEISEIFTEWNKGDLESYLIEITAEVLKQVDAETGKPLVDVILDQAGSKGTGVWTVQTALDLGIPVSGIAEAVFARSVSSKPAQRAAAAALPGPTVNPVEDVDGFIEGVRQALYASKVIAYSQGFDAIVAGAEQYNWDIKKGDIAKIWRGGCIIRARFLNRITEAYTENPGLVSLVTAPFFTDVVATAQDSWRNVVADAAHAGIPAPVFASSLAYYDSLRADRLPAALTQGQRDFFGAHTYKRVDKEGTFHTLWSGDRTEIVTEGSSH